MQGNLPKKPNLTFEQLDKDTQKIVLRMIRNYCGESKLYEIMLKEGISNQLVNERIIMLFDMGYCKICHNKEKTYFWIGFWDFNGNYTQDCVDWNVDISDLERALGIEDVNQN